MHHLFRAPEQPTTTQKLVAEKKITFPRGIVANPTLSGSILAGEKHRFIRPQTNHQRLQGVTVSEKGGFGCPTPVHDRFHPAGREGIDEQVDGKGNHTVVAAERLRHDARGVRLKCLAGLDPLFRTVRTVVEEVIEISRLGADNPFRSPSGIRLAVRGKP